MELLYALPDFINSGAPEVLATSASDGANDFLDTTLGITIRAIAGAFGLVVALFGVFKAIGSFLSGRMGQGFKVILGTILLAGILFRLDLLIQFGGWLGDLVGDAIISGEDLSA